MAPTIPVFTFDLNRVEPNLRSGDITKWANYFFTSDVNAPASSWAFEHGALVGRVVGGSGVQSNRREAMALPGTSPYPYWRLKSRWASPPPADGIMEHGHMLNLQKMPDGKWRSVTVWHLIPGFLIAGVWETSGALDGSGFLNFNTSLMDAETITASARNANVVTVTVAAGATSRWKTGDLISVDITDNSYDGTFLITGVTDTTITWAQTAANNASGGTGSLVMIGRNQPFTPTRNYALTDAVRASGVVTSAGLSAEACIQPGDWVSVDMTDNTYDGRFQVASLNGFTNQISWLQAAADDASAGSGVVGKLTPYFVETRLWPNGVLQARLWPDVGAIAGLGGVGGGLLENGPPPWESIWSLTWDMNKLGGGGTVPTGPGIPALIYAHGSSNSYIKYDNIEAEKLVV